MSPQSPEKPGPEKSHHHHLVTENLLPQTFSDLGDMFVVSTSPKAVIEPGSLAAVGAAVVSPEEISLGAEVFVKTTLTRRCSYEEMVHKDDEIGDENVEFRRFLAKITQWLLTLQEIFDERSETTSKCLCNKARTIVQNLTVLGDKMTAVDEKDGAGDNVDRIDDLRSALDQVQSALKSGVSIQISRPNDTVAKKASEMLKSGLSSCSESFYVRSVINSIISLVNKIMNVPKCGHGSNVNLLDDTDRIRDELPVRLMEQDEEDDIRVRVASMLHDDDDDDDDDDDEDNVVMDTDVENSPNFRLARKRKQLGAVLAKSVKTSPTSSPSKRARRGRNNNNGNFVAPSSAPPKLCQTSPALELLETKKKVQRNSLYHWVLWREALRGEKDRAVTPRRLSFT